MKLHKKLIIVAATVFVVGGAGTGVALAMQPDEPKKAVVEQSAAVEPVAEVAPVVPTPVSEQESTEPEQQPKTVDEIKAIARQIVISDGQNEENASCFGAAIDKRYGWANVTEQFVTDKFTELDSIYVGMCPAMGQLFKLVGGTEKAYDPAFQFPENTPFPPGFRD